MDALLGSVSIGFLLRSLFAGVFYVLSYYTAKFGIDGLGNRFAPEPQLFALALFSGVTIYGLHRSLLYPPLEWLYDTPVMKRFRRKFPLISDSTLQDLRVRWDRYAGKEDPGPERARAICSWADLAHMQYASALCIAAGALIASLDPELKLAPSVPLIATGGVLLLSALISDWRLHSVEEFLSK